MNINPLALSLIILHKLIFKGQRMELEISTWHLQLGLLYLDILEPQFSISSKKKYIS